MTLSRGYRKGALIAALMLGLLVIASFQQMNAAPRYQDDWWNASWHYRMRIDVNASDFTRTDWPVEKDLNFTAIMNSLNMAGTFDVNSTRVVEYNASGSILHELPSQFDLADDFNSSRNAHGELVFILNGTTQNATTRYFYVYFDTNVYGNKSKGSYASKLNYTWDGKEAVINNSKFLVYIDTSRGDATSGVYRVFGIADETEWFFPAGADEATMEYTQLTNGTQDFGFDLRNNASFTAGPVRIRMRQSGSEILWNQTGSKTNQTIVKDYYFYPNSSWLRVRSNITNAGSTPVSRSSNVGISAFDVMRAYDTTYKVDGNDTNPGSWIRGTYVTGGTLTGFIHTNSTIDSYYATSTLSPDRIGINMNATAIPAGGSISNAFAMVFGHTVSTPGIMEDTKDRLIDSMNFTEYTPEEWVVNSRPNTTYAIYNRNESIFITGNVTFDPWNITSKMNVTLDMGTPSGADDQTVVLSWNATFGNQTAGYKLFTGRFNISNSSTIGYWNLTVRAYDKSGYYLNESYYTFNVTSTYYANLTILNALGLPSRLITANLDVKNYRQDTWIPGASINCSYGGVQVTNITNNGNGTYSINFTAPTLFGLYNLNCSASKDGNLGYDNKNFTVEAAKTNVSISRSPSAYAANNVTLYLNETFGFNVTLQNDGNSSAYTMNITLSLPTNWTSSPASSGCEDIPISGVCTKAFNITVPRNASAGSYIINVSANWTNLDTTTSFNTTFANVTVGQNARLEVPQDSLTVILGPGNTTLIGSFIVNSTGNYPLSTIGFSVSGLNDFVMIFTPPSIGSLGIGQTQNVQVTVIVPSNQLPGIYNGTINVSSGNDGFDIVSLTIIVTGTNMSIERQPQNFTANVNSYQNDSFVLHAEANNTGNVTAFYTTLNLSLPQNWAANATSYPCGNVTKGSACGHDFLITVPNGTQSGYYLANITVNWQDIGIGPRSNTTSVNVTVAPNVTLAVPQDLISSTMEHGTTKTIGTLTLNSTGNDPVTSITFNISGLSNMTITFSPSSVANLSSGAVQNVTVNATVPAGYDPGTYNGTINVSSGNDGFKMVNVSITVPQNGSWTVDKTYCEHVQSPNQDYVCNVTINNTGNLQLNFSIIPATSNSSMSNYSWTNVTSFVVAKQTAFVFSVLYNVTGVAGQNWKNSNYTIDPQQAYAAPNFTILEIRLNPNLNPVISLSTTPTKGEQTSFFMIYANASSQSGMGITYVIANVTKPDGTYDAMNMTFMVGGGCFPPGAYSAMTCWHSNYTQSWGQTLLRGNYTVNVTVFDNSQTNATVSANFSVYTKLKISMSTGTPNYVQGYMGYINFKATDYTNVPLAGVNATISIINPSNSTQGILFTMANYTTGSDGWAQPFPYFTLTNDAGLGTYNLTASSAYYDSGASIAVNSTDKVQFGVNATGSAGILALASTPPIWYPNNQMTFSIQVFDSNFISVDPDQLNLTIYAGSPLLNNIYLQVNLSSPMLQRIETGRYALTYVMPPTTPTGDYWAIVHATKGSFSSPALATPFRVAAGGPYDVRLRVLESEVARGDYVDFEIVVENMGEAGQDVDLTYWVSDGTQTWSMGSEAIYTPAHVNDTILRSLYIFSSQPLGLDTLNLVMNYSSLNPTITKNVTFMVTNETVQQPPPPSGGGGNQPPGGGGPPSGGGGGPSGNPKISITNYPDAMGVEVGVSKITNIEIKNIGDADATGISISLSGIDASWFELGDTLINVLKPNETRIIPLRILAPSGTKSGNFIIKIRAQANDTSDQKLFGLNVFTSRQDLVEFELARLKAKTDELELKTNNIKDQYDVTDVLKLIPEIRTKITETEGYLNDKKYDAALASIYAGWEIYNRAAAMLETVKPKVAPELIPMWLLLVILMMVGVILFLMVVLRKLSLNMKVLLRGRYTEAKTVAGIVKKEPETDSLRMEREKLQRMLSLLEGQYKQGIISKEAYDGLRTSSEAKIKALDERIRKEIKV